MFLLNTQSKEPIFEQIQNQILRFIQAGVLAPGDRLPSVRQLAQELEKNGYVYNIPKKGVYVSDIDLKQSHSNQIVKVLQPLKDSGIQKQELMDAIEILYKENATC